MSRRELKVKGNPYPTITNTEFKRNFVYQGGEPSGLALNVPLLRKMVEWVEEDAKRDDTRDKQWYQADWVKVWEETLGEDQTICTTACCVAGNVAVMDNAVVRVAGMDEYYAKHPTRKGKYCSISEYARVTLGLDNFEATNLFDGDNSASDIRAIAEGITMNRTGERL